MANNADRNPICKCSDIKMASTSFTADLPDDMTGEQFEKLYAWGKSCCEHFDVRRQEDGTMLLDVVRKKSGTTRDHMRLLKTNLKNWGINLPTKQAGWLRLVDDSSVAEPEVQAQLTHALPEEHATKTSLPKTMRSGCLMLPENLLTVPCVEPMR